MSPIQAISAPYNFVPLSEWVHCPDWASQVSQDLPFRDGLSGHLDLTITAHSPILVGGEQRKATDDEPGEVHPYRLPGGRYALPGTSLKGMIRSVVEIAGFSRMSAVDDIRYGLRDISGKYVSAAYSLRVRNKVMTGFMRVGRDGFPRIIPCAMVRLSHRDLEGWLGLRAPIFSADRSVAKKYRQWVQICKRKSIAPDLLYFSPSDDLATRLGEGTVAGVPVFTGQINDSTKPKGKQRDFVFYDANEAEAFAPRPADWGDFLYVHGDQDSKDAEAMSWPGYWKQRYWDGEDVPVFFLRDAAKTRIGLAYMPRLAGDFSVSEMIAHTSPEHLRESGRGPWDFAEALFGTVGDSSADCVKGRVTFQHAPADGTPQPEACQPTILNGPKASYFPSYVKQNADPVKWKLRGSSYATCIATQENPRPEVRGWKRYPARAQYEVQALTRDQADNRKVQVILYPLPAGSTFQSRLSFHNLRSEELGALCWALTWGGSDDLRHGLGMGKPFGFGQVAIKIAGVGLRPNRRDASVPRWEECRDAFIAHMEAAAQARGIGWRDSQQIKALLGMADPTNADRFSGKLRHMRLEPKQRVNEFVDAKQAGLVLADYPQTTHPPTWGEQEAKRQTEAKRLANEQADRERQEEERAAQEKENAEFEALPPEQKLIVTTEREYGRYAALGEHCQRQERAALNGVLNKLQNAAVTWTDMPDRRHAADLLECIYDEIGWADPGQKKGRRQKQEGRRREKVEQIRNRDGSG